MGPAFHVVDLDRFKTRDQAAVCSIVNTRDYATTLFSRNGRATKVAFRAIMGIFPRKAKMNIGPR
jgi:hypothetical protein